MPAALESLGACGTRVLGRNGLSSLLHKARPMEVEMLLASGRVCGYQRIGWQSPSSPCRIRWY